MLDRIFHDNFSEDEEIVVLATDYIQKVSDIIKTTSKRYRKGGAGGMVGVWRKMRALRCMENRLN